MTRAGEWKHRGMGFFAARARARALLSHRFRRRPGSCTSPVRRRRRRRAPLAPPPTVWRGRRPAPCRAAPRLHRSPSTAGAELRVLPPDGRQPLALSSLVRHLEVCAQRSEVRQVSSAAAAAPAVQERALQRWWRAGRSSPAARAPPPPPSPPGSFERVAPLTSQSQRLQRFASSATTEVDHLLSRWSLMRRRRRHRRRRRQRVRRRPSLKEGTFNVKTIASDVAGCARCRDIHTQL